VGAADADGACVEVVVLEAFVAFGDGEVELVHPAAAIQKSNMAHTASIAACFCFNVTPLNSLLINENVYQDT
jgi:hypothetical protein